MLYALICTDKAKSVDLRMSVRPDHVAFLQGLGDTLKAAGPFLNDEGSPIGSLVVIEAGTKQEAEAIAVEDPYAKAGLFETVEITQWNWILKNPEG